METLVQPTEQRFVLPNVSWKTYEHLLADFADSRSPRFTYDRGMLEIMSPLPEHEELSHNLAMLVEIAAEAIDLHIPAVAEIAELVGCKPIGKRNWITHGGTIYSRVRSVTPIDPKPMVVDLKVDVDESYQTVAGLAHNGGKRKGAVCTYLETWHLDIEEFLELRKNTGDDRRRTHDMNTANWIPDLFMKRVIEGGDWTLFSPSDVPDLHDKWGHAFDEAYRRHEERVARGELKLFKRLPAVQLWRKMLSMLFETGHPWITFKDACNVRSPQQHVGTVHSSNLCTEITLNTSEAEIAVCNLGSINLLAHMVQDTQMSDGRWTLDHTKLQQVHGSPRRIILPRTRRLVVM